MNQQETSSFFGNTVSCAVGTGSLNSSCRVHNRQQLDENQSTNII